MEIITGLQHKPGTFLIYGPPGVGKTLSAMGASGALGGDGEGGMNHVKGRRTGRLKTFKEVREFFRFAAEDPETETAVVDSLTAIEEMLIAEILAEDEAGKKSLADFPYGRGYELLASKYNLFLKMCTKLNELGKNVILIAHEQIQRFEDPASESYDRYVPAVHKKALPSLIAHMDAVLFMRHETHTTARNDGGFSKDKKRGLGTGRRIIQTQEAPAWLAKNRFGLPDIVEAGPDIWTMMGIGKELR